MITIFGRLSDIHPGIIPAKWCAIPPQESPVINIFLVFVLDVYYVCNYLHENTQNQQQIYIQSAYLKTFVFRNEKLWKDTILSLR